ncbi:hypothetical protein DUHN55_28440 [Helicobacter pylori]
MGSAVLGAREIAVDSFCDSLAVHVLYEAIDIQSEFFRVTNKVLSLKRVLMGEDEVEPCPELTLVRGGPTPGSWTRGVITRRSAA